MSVEARGGAFRARVRRRGVYLTATFSTQADAEAWRASAVASIDPGETPEPPTRPDLAAPVRPLTVDEACREWSRDAKAGIIRTRRGHPYKPATLRGAENRLRLYVVARLGAVPLHALRRGDVRRLVEEVAAEKSPATAANVRDALRVVLQRQVDLEVISENVAAGVRARPSTGRRPGSSRRRRPTGYRMPPTPTITRWSARSWRRG